MNAVLPILNPSHVDRRRERRVSVLKSAKIIYGGSWGTIVDCLILDLSDQGGRVETILAVDIPDYFYVKFNDGAEHLGHRRWSSGNQIGVEFVSGGT